MRTGLFAVLLAAAASGCVSAPEPGAAGVPRRLRVGYPGPQGFGELPSFVANRELTTRGFEIETTFFVQPELAVQALTQGSIDLSVGSSRIYWVAVQRGAPLVAIIEGSRRNHVLIARKDITSCAGLAGQRVGLSGLAAMGSTLFREYVRIACPGTDAQTVLIAGSPSRIAALMTGTIDATVSFRAEAVDLLRCARDRFHVLSDFESRWSDLITSAMFVNAAFAREHAAEIQEYVDAMLAATRALAKDAAVAAREAAALMPAHESYDAIADAYIGAAAWDPSGGLAPDSVASTLQFLVKIGELKEPLPENRLVDRSFLDRARTAATAQP
jgi:ABC-type nitrate/sulfonate/bicarbonate transport system substrate-binding protein